MIRTFKDPDGNEWEVFEVRPQGMRGAITAARADRDPMYSNGWLCFGAGGAKRRLSPPPSYWEHSSDEELCRLLARASAARKMRPLPDLLQR